MVKMLGTQQTTSAPDQTKKQRRKQAKREAKVMLEIEQAKKDVQKAEQKLAKAQAQLEASKTHLSSLEAQAEEMRAPQNHAGVGKKNKRTDTGTTSVSTASQHDAENHAPISPPTNQVSSLPPAEGRSDIASDQEASAPATQEPSELPEPALIGNALPHVETYQEAMQTDNTAHDDVEAEEEDEQTPHKTRRSTRRRRSPEHSTEEEQETASTDEIHIDKSQD